MDRLGIVKTASISYPAKRLKEIKTARKTRKKNVEEFTAFSINTRTRDNSTEGEIGYRRCF
ncbi:UNVERIFIED_CONTAM: hypothetical protein NCL1_06166 [Trichonephila clavipes]